MLLAGFAALAGLAPLAYALLSGYLWLLFSWDFLSGWLRATDGDDSLIGMVLAAGAGRRLRPDTDALPKALLPVDGETTILDIALRNLAAVGLRDVVIVVGHAADAIADRLGRPGAGARGPADAGAQRPGRGVEQRLLALAGPRVLRGGRAAGQRRHRASGQGGEDAAGRRAAPAAAAARQARRAGLILAVDDVKRLADEEMKVVIDAGGLLTRITKLMDPAQAYGEYIGATLIEPVAAAPLAEALEATWRRDPALYYEDGFQELADRGGEIAAAPIGEVEWVEVDDHDDLRRAREIAGRC